METTNILYTSPEVEIIEVAVEKGFALSDGIPIDPDGTGDGA